MLERTNKFPEVSVVSRIMHTHPTSNSQKCPCSKVPATDMVKCKLRKGRGYPGFSPWSTLLQISHMKQVGWSQRKTGGGHTRGSPSVGL